MLFIQNKYTQWYYSIIENAKSRPSSTNKITEKHHIIPESFYKNRSRSGRGGWLDGDPNIPENIVALTPREHFVCHLLLTKMVERIEGRRKMESVIILMSPQIGDKGRLCSKLYEKFCMANRERNREVQKSLVADGKHHLQTDESKERSRQTMLTRLELGTHVSQTGIGAKASRERVANGTHNWLKDENGNSASSRLVEMGCHNFQGSDAPSQHKWRCEYCLKEGKGKGNYTKYHGKNCVLVKDRPRKTADSFTVCEHCGEKSTTLLHGRYHGDKCPCLDPTKSIEYNGKRYAYIRQLSRDLSISRSQAKRIWDTQKINR